MTMFVSAIYYTARSGKKHLQTLYDAKYSTQLLVNKCFDSCNYMTGLRVTLQTEISKQVLNVLPDTF